MKNTFRIIQIAKPLYNIIALSAFLILITSIFGVAIPLMTSNLALNEIALKISGQGGSLEKLYFFIGLIFLITILNTVIVSLSNRLGDHLAGRFRKFLTEIFYDKVLSLPQSYFDSELSGKIINQLNRGINSIQRFINQSTNFVLPSFMQAILTIAVLAYYDKLIAVLIFSLFPIYIVISYYSSKAWGKKEMEKNRIEDKARGRFSEVVTNIRLVKSSITELSEHKYISKNLSEINKIYAKQSRNYHLMDFLRNFGLNAILSLITLVAVYNAFQGLIDFPRLFLIIQMINQARIPLFAMSFIISQIQEAESGSKEFLDILNLPSKEDYAKEEDLTRISKPTIEFKDVEFQYNTSTKVLDRVSFKVNQNEVVALVGPSGAGKSTIINLILKFYDPTSGEIKLNDKNYTELSHKFVRNNVALVFQENELFSSTIKENVAYGKANATDEEVIKALKLANAYGFVSKLQDGVNSEIGERGVRLSGGQKQRIQIARAILKDAPILILDEATSSLDAKSEHEVQEALENLMKNKLTIIIAHRFSTIQNATKVIVLDEQKIQDIGTPQELAKRGGIYADLLNYQIEGNKKLLKKFEIY